MIVTKGLGGVDTSEEMQNSISIKKTQLRYSLQKSTL